MFVSIPSLIGKKVLHKLLVTAINTYRTIYKIYHHVPSLIICQVKHFSIVQLIISDILTQGITISVNFGFITSRKEKSSVPFLP